MTKNARMLGRAYRRVDFTLVRAGMPRHIATHWIAAHDFDRTLRIRHMQVDARHCPDGNGHVVTTTYGKDD